MAERAEIIHDLRVAAEFTAKGDDILVAPALLRAAADMLEAGCRFEPLRRSRIDELRKAIRRWIEKPHGSTMIGQAWDVKHESDRESLENFLYKAFVEIANWEGLSVD